MSSDEPHPLAFEELPSNIVRTKANEIHSQKPLQSSDGSRISVAASAGAAAAVLGAGFALTKLLRRRLSQRKRDPQEKGLDKHSERHDAPSVQPQLQQRPLTRRRRAAATNGGTADCAEGLEVNNMPSPRRKGSPRMGPKSMDGTPARRTKIANSFTEGRPHDGATLESSDAAGIPQHPRSAARTPRRSSRLASSRPASQGGSPPEAAVSSHAPGIPATDGKLQNRSSETAGESANKAEQEGMAQGLATPADVGSSSVATGAVALPLQHKAQQPASSSQAALNIDRKMKAAARPSHTAATAALNGSTQRQVLPHEEVAGVEALTMEQILAHVASMSRAGSSLPVPPVAPKPQQSATAAAQSDAIPSATPLRVSESTPLADETATIAAVEYPRESVDHNAAGQPPKASQSHTDLSQAESQQDHQQQGFEGISLHQQSGKLDGATKEEVTRSNQELSELQANALTEAEHSEPLLMPHSPGTSSAVTAAADDAASPQEAANAAAPQLLPQRSQLSSQDDAADKVPPQARQSPPTSEISSKHKESEASQQQREEACVEANIGVSADTDTQTGSKQYIGSQSDSASCSSKLNSPLQGSGEVSTAALSESGPQLPLTPPPLPQLHDASAPAGSASDDSPLPKHASLLPSPVAASSKLNPAAKEFCPGGFTSLAPTAPSWADRVKVAASAIPTPVPSKPPGALWPPGSQPHSCQQQARGQQQQPASAPKGSRRRGANSSETPQKRKQTKAQQRFQQNGASSEAAPEPPATAQASLRKENSSHTDLRATGGTRASASGTVDEPHAKFSAAGDDKESQLPSNPSMAYSEDSTHPGASPPTKRWADLLVDDEEAAAAKLAAELAAATPPATASTEAVTETSVAPAADSAPGTAESQDDGWTQVAHRSVREKRRGTRGGNPSHEEHPVGAAAAVQPLQRTASSGGSWGRSHQPSTTNGWQDAPSVRPLNNGSRAQARPHEQEHQKQLQSGSSSNSIRSQVAAPEAGSREVPDTADREGSAGVVSSSNQPGDTGRNMAAGAVSIGSADGSDSKSSSSRKLVAQQASALPDSDEPAAQQACVLDDSTPVVNPASAVSDSNEPVGQQAPAVPDSSKPAPQLASAVSDGEAEHAPPQSADTGRLSNDDLADEGPAAAPSTAAVAESAPSPTEAAESNHDSQEAESAPKRSEDESSKSQLAPPATADDSNINSVPPLSADVAAVCRAVNETDVEHCDGDSIADVAVVGSADEAVEDPDMPGTPDQSGSATHQVAASMSVAEEEYSTPAVSDGGGSDNLTTTSTRSNAAAIDPLGIMSGASTAEEQTKAVKQAKQLIAEGLRTYTTSGNVDGAEKRVGTAVRVLRDAGVGGEPLAEAEAALGDIYHGTGRMEDALDHLTLAHQVAEEADSSGTPVRTELSVKLANNLGTVLVEAGQTQKAAVLAQRFSEATAARHGIVSRWTTHSRIQAAAALEASGNKEAAVEALLSAADQLLEHASALEAASEADREAAAPEHRVPNGISAAEEEKPEVVMEVGDGEDSNMDALPAELVQQEEQDPVVAARHAGARLLVASGEHLVRCNRPVDAEKAFRAASSAAEEAWGPQAPHSFFVRSQLASFLRTRPGAAAKAEAVELHEGLLSMTEKHRGQDYQTSIALETMARVYLEANRPMDAIVVAQRSIDVVSTLLTQKRHPALEKPYACLAAAKEAAGDVAGAREAHKLALSMRADAHSRSRGGPSTQRPTMQRPQRRR